MNTCKTCKYWGKDNCGDEDWEFDCRICLHPMVAVFDGYSREQPTMISSGVYKFDEGGGTSMFITGPDFGCIHHEVKL